MKFLPLTIAFASLVVSSLSMAAAAPAEKAKADSAPASSNPSASPNVPASNTADADRPRLLHNIELVIDDDVTPKEYAEQLDYFHIELGAEDSKGLVQYAGHLTATRPERHSGPRQEDPRITIELKRGGLMAHDRKMLTKAGVQTQGKRILQFYPREVEDQLIALEQSYTGLAKPDIARTQFKIRPKTTGRGFEFYINELDLAAESAGKKKATSQSKGND